MTLDKIAQELGISKSTVSRALSGKGRIGKETVELVQNFVWEHNHVEEEKEILKNSTLNIGVVLPADIYRGGGSYFQNCLLGICEAASMFGYNVLIITGKQHDISELMFLVENKRVDGVILTRSFEDDRALRYLTEKHFPTALTGTCQYEEVIQVDTDNEEAAEKMTSMLIGRKFKKFALLVKDMSFIADKKRHDGFCKALFKNGISKQSQIFYNGSVKMEFLDSIIGNLIAQKVECVICGDDEVCTMIMSRLQAEGYRIPMDIAVASLYNSPNLECYSPAVTAVNVAASQMGNVAGKQLIQCLLGRKYEARVILDHDIIFRKSTN
ncbi:transcriptional regulator, LacI family [Anaerocolumna jejuensis DSM 15929]|uniref:Transcriptional regulator, LacI family n=1 Tax=Anaerocolumna jejuensis DSM 15929 TaxID=1121322 RepID=A0A1M6MGU2_9FIRM|nr:LacI family DNA-binding transcriptional regulator [Anaerocolumna jejuensis]SHJ82682.1 transcriptional regulator, LacI family [Anaerocolumna jejuensis DSM 15929]